jgi:hypothetical protein
MPDLDPGMKVGEVIWDTKYLLDLPVGTTIIGIGPDVAEGETWTRVVNGYLCTTGHATLDAGEFVPNAEVSKYFQPGGNEILALPGVMQTTFTTEKVLDGIEISTPSGCDCGNCECGKEDGADVETIKPEEFVPKFPNDPDDPNKETPRGDVLREAEFLITGDRNKTYGPPTQNFLHIAELLNTRFGHKLKPSARFNGSDVADLMILVKVARNISDTKRDNWVDIAGYAACGYECTLDEN